MNAQRELHILVLNRGSSSVKFGLYQVFALHTQPLVSAEAESIGSEVALFHANDFDRDLVAARGRCGPAKGTRLSALRGRESTPECPMRAIYSGH